MPTLVLPPRRNDDCRAMAEAAGAAGWKVWAAPGWRIPAGLTLEEPVPYSDPLFADVAAAHFGLALLEPPLDFLPRLPEQFRGRAVELTTLGEARGRPGEAEAAHRFAAAVLSAPGQILAPAFVLDVGIMDRPQGWAVAEANPAWGSGIYGCEPAAVLRAVRRAVAQRTRLSVAEAAFARSAVAVEG